MLQWKNYYQAYATQYWHRQYKSLVYNLSIFATNHVRVSLWNQIFETRSPCFVVHECCNSMCGLNSWRILLAWASAGGGQNGHLPPLDIGTKNQKFLENLKLAAKFRLNNFNCCNDSLFAGMRLTLHKSQVHCSDVMQWHQNVAVRSFACRGRLRSLRADCSTVVFIA